MKNITSILVPVDFSDLSKEAFQYALQLADHFEASVDLMYCIPPSTSGFTEAGVTVNLLAALEDTARHNMSAFYEEGLAVGKANLMHQPKVTTFLETGDLQLAIQRQAKERENDLILMATRGSEDGWDTFWGTNTSFLTSKAPCPVLVIPPNTTFRPFQSIGYATDLKHIDAFQAGNIQQAFWPFSPNLHFVHVQPTKEEETDFDLPLLRKMFRQPETGFEPTFTTLYDDNIVAGLFDFAEERHCDLIVMFRPQRSWFERLFSKSHTREAVMKTSMPLLILGADAGAK